MAKIISIRLKIAHWTHRLAETNNPQLSFSWGHTNVGEATPIFFTSLYLGVMYFISALFMLNRPYEVHFVVSYLGLQRKKCPEQTRFCNCWCYFISILVLQSS